MEGFEILIGREYVDPKLPMGSDPSLSRIMGQLNLYTCFAGMFDGKNVASCLLNEPYGANICDVLNIAVADEYSNRGFRRELLIHVMDYAKKKGFRFLEIGAGNADLASHKGLQRMGYRVTGVVPDYYQSDAKSLSVEHGIVNRDLIRYRIDFNDGWSTHLD